MTLRNLSLFICAVATLSTTAHAQFTAAVVPPRAKAKVDTTAKQDSVRRAAVALAARVTDMKRWVDSAAGVPLPPQSDSAATASDSTPPATKDSVVLRRNERIRADSAASIATVEVHDSTGLRAQSDSASSPTTPARSRKGRNAVRDTVRDSAGATAPNTATELPLLALIAATALLAGAALRRS